MASHQNVKEQHNAGSAVFPCYSYQLPPQGSREDLDNTPTRRLNLRQVRQRLKKQGEDHQDDSRACSNSARRPAIEVNIGSILGQCILTSLIGEGSWGRVFRAWHQGLGLTVAIKVLHPEVRHIYPEAFEQLCWEGQLLCRLRHPNIVYLFDLEDRAECPFMMMEYVEGLSLWDVIQLGGRVQLAKLLPVVKNVALGLQSARKRGVIHQDVKPSNLLLDIRGNVKIVDWGQATILPEQVDESWPPPRRWQEGVKGTAAYMAPEQFSNPQQVDHRSDIYSLGATFYHALVGMYPFTASSADEVIQKNLHEPVTFPHVLVPEIPEQVSNVIVRMMAKEPEERYQSYQELLLDLDKLYLLVDIPWQSA
jgi:serine/threonine protein kinase